MSTKDTTERCYNFTTHMECDKENVCREPIIFNIHIIHHHPKKWGRGDSNSHALSGT